MWTPNSGNAGKADGWTWVDPDTADYDPWEVIIDDDGNLEPLCRRHGGVRVTAHRDGLSIGTHNVVQIPWNALAAYLAAGRCGDFSIDDLINQLSMAEKQYLTRDSSD